MQSSLVCQVAVEMTRADPIRARLRVPSRCRSWLARDDPARVMGDQSHVWIVIPRPGAASKIKVVWMPAASCVRLINSRPIPRRCNFSSTARSERYVQKWKSVIALDTPTSRVPFRAVTMTSACASMPRTVSASATGRRSASVDRSRRSLNSSGPSSGYVSSLYTISMVLQARLSALASYTALDPSCSSIRRSWLYLAIRSERLMLPVLICPQLVATAMSAMVVSSVSPDR